MKNIQSNWIKTFFVGVLLIVVWKIIDINWLLGALGKTMAVLTPFIFGAIIAFFTYRPSVKLEKALRGKCKKIKPNLARSISVIFVYLAFIIILTVILQFLIPAIYKNIQDLISNMPTYYKTATTFIRSLDFVEYFNIEEKITETLSNYLSFDMMGKFVGVISSVASSMLNVVLGFVLSIYILIERRSLLSLFKTLVRFIIKDKKTTTLTVYTTKLVEIFNAYFVSLLLDAVIIGGVSAIFFFFFGAPYPWLLGLIIAIGNMIPFFGPIAAAVIVYIICALVMGPFAALWALLFQIIVGQLDSNLLQPKVVGNSVGISPLWVIFAVTFFGGIWGPVGMIIGVPIVASLRFLYHDYREDGKLDGNLGTSQ